MKRREFLMLVGGAATSWPLSAYAQRPAIPVIGFLRSTTFSNAAHLVAAFRQGLKDEGFVEGQNVAIEFRSAEGDTSRLSALAADLVRQRVTVIVGNSIAVRAAKEVTSTIPIVFTTGGDPIKDGLVTSLNRPDRNVTGASFLGAALGSKRLELLRQLLPNTPTIAMLFHPSTPYSMGEQREVQAAASAIGQKVLMVEASDDQEIERAFAIFVQGGAGGLLVGGGGFLFSRREHVVALAARHKLPAIYTIRDNAIVGGLMSYGASNADAYRQAGAYAGRILKGEKPAELPVVQPTKFELVLNLRTSRALGLAIPDRLLALADEVIE